MTRVVIIESPYFGVPDACRYLACCLLDSLLRGEAPIASHGLYPLALPEHVVVDGTERTGREIGIEAWKSVVELVRLCSIRDMRVFRVFYFEPSAAGITWTDGMRAAWDASEPWERTDRTLQGRARAIWLAGEWPSPARLTLNHEVP